jgi:hypothetical protein
MHLGVDSQHLMVLPQKAGHTRREGSNDIAALGSMKNRHSLKQQAVRLRQANRPFGSSAIWRAAI